MLQKRRFQEQSLFQLVNTRICCKSTTKRLISQIFTFYVKILSDLDRSFRFIKYRNFLYNVEDMRAKFDKRSGVILKIGIGILILPVILYYLGAGYCFISLYGKFLLVIGPIILLFASSASPKEVSDVRISRLNKIRKTPMPNKLEQAYRDEIKGNIHIERGVGLALLVVFWSITIFFLIRDGVGYLSC